MEYIATEAMVYSFLKYAKKFTVGEIGFFTFYQVKAIGSEISFSNIPLYFRDVTVFGLSIAVFYDKDLVVEMVENNDVSVYMILCVTRKKSSKSLQTTNINIYLEIYVVFENILEDFK